jgi:arginyl-tRNA synthetase
MPTYEAKEIGLNIEKFNKYPDLDQSIIVTANEQNAYFKVVLKAFSLIDATIFEKTKHMSHGILRFSSGKMSSRKGNIISAESLINEIRDMVTAKMDTGKMQESGTLSEQEKDEVVDTIAIGAIKYTILRQSIGGDVIFDSAVRAQALLEKAVQAHIVGSAPEYKIIKTVQFPEKVTMLEKLLSRYDDIQEYARIEYAPQHIAQYLTALAGAFNAYYATHQIVDEHDALSVYRVQLTKEFLQTMTQGLWLLGINVPSRM